MSEKATVFFGTVDGFRTTKKGINITLHLPKNLNDTNKVAELLKYDKMPVKFAMKLDNDQIEENETKITESQRKTIFKLIGILSDHFGYTKEEGRNILTEHFCSEMSVEPFSLSDVEKEIATDFIKCLVEWGLAEGINMFDWLRDDIDLAMTISVKYKKCVICGKDGDIHHIDRIGMGNNRKNDEGKRTICLCREHHATLHTIGDKAFSEKYHINLGR